MPCPTRVGHGYAPPNGVSVLSRMRIMKFRRKTRIRMTVMMDTVAMIVVASLMVIANQLVGPPRRRFCDQCNGLSI
ncbi:hypothetical protein QJS04_geneDACA021083 [Acorus gramineus]|uniref:Uncharacterized protein n=1 Tax=Acorus gramineus TaxID=55184 RepID=A0AAV9A1Z5_ACOGR|nr:hypothetical protein QJS04_geneDACA021083 [Acorus gramineus]